MVQQGVTVFSEGADYLCDDYKELVEAFSRYPELLTTKGRTFSLAVTGFLIFNNSPVVVFPKGFKTSSEMFRSDAATLLQVLLRYRMEKIHPDDEPPFLNGNEMFSNGRIIQAILLINDYQRHGFLRRKELRMKTRISGNIDWNSTINKTEPVFSHGAPVYTDPVIRTSAYDENNMVIRIHKAVISECFYLWGWITGSLADDADDIDYEMPCSTEEAIVALQNELSTTFISRELDVLRNMISYLQSKTGSRAENHIEILATPYFYYVWEYICGHIFKNQYSTLASIVPSPVWKNCPVNHNISQRPDILFVDGNRLFILDAKYYDYYRSLPRWHDVSKQFFYQYTIAHNSSSKARRMLSNVDEVFNAFILPENDSEESVYTGTVEVQNVFELGHIHSFAINTRKAMNSYAFGTDSSARAEVICKILSSEANYISNSN